MAIRRLWMRAPPALFAAILLAQKPGALDKINQTLNVPKDPPLVAVGDASRLVFHTSPLSGQGLLTQQTRDALKAILKLNGNAPIVHVRAFSAGNGDIRRIPQIVSDVLGEKHGPLPSVSIVQAGALTVDDAQVVLETVSIGRKDTNKDGITFYPAETAAASDPESPVKPLLAKAIDQLSAKMDGHPALAVTCYVSAFQNAAELFDMVRSRFAGAAVDLVQPRRLPWKTEASCEGVARGGGLRFPSLAFSGTQVAFGLEEKDAALAVQRLDRALTEAGAPRTSDASLVRFYLLTPDSATIALKQLNGAAPKSAFSVEGVGAASAGFAIDAVAPVR